MANLNLIYGEFVNDEIRDINVLQDYSYDAVVGVSDNSDVNTFECRVQEYNNRCKVDNVLYVEFTEYGGIIDRIEHIKESGEVIYKGRTWHGIMNSHVIKWRKGYSGEVNEIITQILHDADLDNLFVCDLVPEEERIYEVADFSVSWEKAYDAIIKLLRDGMGGGKLVCYYYNGKVHLGAVLSTDYSANEEFDTSKTPYRTGRTENTVNHLICLGQGEAENRAVIHLFTDDIQQDLDHEYHIQPYTLVKDPIQDSDYILDERNKVMAGKDEICEILDIPNCEIVTNYPRLTEKPADWNAHYFEKYYEDGEVDANTGLPKKQLIKEIRRDEYRRVDAIDGTQWQKNFTEYFVWDSTKASDGYYIGLNGDKTIVKARENDAGAVHYTTGGMSSVKERSESELTVGNGISYTEINVNDISDEAWETGYATYYIQNGTAGYTNVPSENVTVYGNSIADVGGNVSRGLKANLHNGNKLTAQPPDWAWNFANYCTRNKNAVGTYIYTQVQGVEHYHFEQVKSKKAPSKWENEWSSYYVKDKKKVAKKGKYIDVNGSHYITASEAVSLKVLSKQSNEKPYPKYQQNRFYIKVQEASTAPDFSRYYTNKKSKSLGDGVFEKYSFNVEPAKDKYPHYYRKDINTAPTFVSGKYYTLVTDQLQIPDFKRKPYYRAVQDRLRRLVEKGIEELKKLNDKDSLQMDLELDSNYDVLDVMGLTDEVTGVPIHKPILRKIIKIKKDIMSVEYEME